MDVQPTFSNPCVLQPATTYSTKRDAFAIADNTDPSGRETGRCDGVRLGDAIRHCIFFFAS